MLRIHTVVGARPQFIKAAAISRNIKAHFQDQIQETIIHTGQHYDDKMSSVFFDQLEIPAPHINLGIGGKQHVDMIATMMQHLEKEFRKGDPHCVLVYGDTNSTLAAALTASRMNIPVAHVEAGLRSFRKSMPEEVNRKLTDQVSSFLFCPTDQAVENLLSEGIDGIFKNKPTADKPLMLNVGDVMYDNILHYAQKIADAKLSFELEKDNYILCTIHRDFNTDQPERLIQITQALIALAEVYKYKILVPMHPRTSEVLKKPEYELLYKKLSSLSNIILTEPLPYFENLHALSHCRIVLTDSGGLQKEAYFMKKPVVVLRPETEWTEIVTAGYAVCADADKEDIINGTMKLLGFSLPEYQELYGDGEAALSIIRSLTTFLK